MMYKNESKLLCSVPSCDSEARSMWDGFLICVECYDALIEMIQRGLGVPYPGWMHALEAEVAETFEVEAVVPFEEKST